MTTDVVARSLGLAICVVLGACAGREFPSRFPEASAASPAAPAPPPVRLRTALEQDPPLPGEPTDGWPGLAQPAGEPQSHPHSHHEPVEQP